MIILVTVIGAVLGWLVGRISYQQGLSSTVAARYHGLGSIGSIIASGIYGFMILGFLALENALLYKGILFFFKIPDNLTNAIIIYGLLTLAWVFLATFGINLVIRVSSIAVVLFLLILLYMLVSAVTHSSVPLGTILTHGAVFPGGNPFGHFVTAVNLLIGSVGALALSDADYTRYAKSSRDVFLIALAGNIMMDVVIFLTGSILIYAGFDTVKQYYVTNGMSVAQASQAALNNVAATFIIMGGIAGTLLMLIAQAKAQVLNTYSGSLALANFFDTLRWRPGRLFMVILGNAISLLMIAGNILNLINSWLTVLGVITTSLAVIMVADYFIVRRASVSLDALTGEAVNWAGVLTLVLGSGIAMYLYQLNIFPVPFVTSTLFSLIIYPILRTRVFKLTAGFNDSILG